MCCPVLCCPVLSWPVLSCPVLCWPVLYCLSCLSYQLILCSSLSSFQNWEFDLSNSIFRSFLSLKKIGRYQIDPVNLYKRSKGAIRSFSQSGRFFDNKKRSIRSKNRWSNSQPCLLLFFSVFPSFLHSSSSFGLSYSLLHFCFFFFPACLSFFPFSLNFLPSFLFSPCHPILNLYLIRRAKIPELLS